MYFSSDITEDEQNNDEHNKSSDFIEKSATDDDDDDDDAVNDTDFEGTLTKIAPEEIEEILKSSDMDRSEIIHTYKMEGLKSTVDIRVANKSTYICQSVGGKVFKGSKWKSTKNVVIEVWTFFLYGMFLFDYIQTIIVAHSQLMSSNIKLIWSYIIKVKIFSFESMAYKKGYMEFRL